MVMCQTPSAITKPSDDRRSTQSVKRPLLVVGLTAVAATVAALWLPPLWAVAAAVMLPLLLIFACLRRQRAALILLTASVFLLSGVGYRYTRVMPVQALDGQSDTLTGRVVELPQNGDMVTLQVTWAERVPVGSRIAVYCPGEIAPQLGDRVTATVELSKVTYSPYYRYANGVFLYAFPLQRDAEHVTVERDAASTLSGWGVSLRRRLSTTLNRVLPGVEGDMLAALCLGQRGILPADLQTAFSRSGLAHLLVVSGLHLSLLSVAVLALLRGSGGGYRWSTVLTVPVMLAFILVVGTSPSVLRAGVMCLVWLLGRLLWRRSDGLNSLGLAAMLLLLDNPYVLLGASFQLSFLATAGVLCLTPRLCRWLYRLPLPETPAAVGWRRALIVIYTGVAVCVSAMLFTLPPLCHYYGGFSLLTVPANLLAVTPAGWALMLGWLGVLCCQTPLLSWLGQPLLMVAGYLTRFLQRIAELCSPAGAYVSVTHLWQLVLVSGLCGIVVYAILRPIHPRRLVAGLLTLTLLAVCVGTPLTRGITRMTVLPVGDGVALLLCRDDRAALVLTDSAGLVQAGSITENLPLDAVFVGVGDPADAGTLASLCRQSGTPILYTADRSYWAAGLPSPTVPVEAGDTVTLWEGCSLTRLPGGYRVDTPGGAVCVATGGADLPADTLTVYDGIPETWPDRYSVVVATTRELSRIRPEFTTPTLVLTEESDSVTFTARSGGEWSVLPWQ